MRAPPQRSRRCFYRSSPAPRADCGARTGRLVAGRDFVPAGSPRNRYCDVRRPVLREFVALQMRPQRTISAESPLAGGREGVPGAQSAGLCMRGRALGHHAGQPALHAEHLPPGRSAAGRPRCSSPLARRRACSRARSLPGTASRNVPRKRRSPPGAPAPDGASRGL